MTKREIEEEALKEEFKRLCGELLAANTRVEEIIDIAHKTNAGLSHKMADELVNLYTEEFRYW